MKNRVLPLLASLLLVTACNFGGKDDASDSAPAASPATKLSSYSTDDLLALLGGSDIGKVGPLRAGGLW